MKSSISPAASECAAQKLAHYSPSFRTKKKSALMLCALAPLFAATSSVQSATSIADFGDISMPSINGKAGGTGWTGNWTGSSNGTVVTGDLTSSLYAAPQSGEQRYRHTNATGLRQNYRSIATPFTGTIWFSFLLMVEVAGDRAGMSINSPTATPFDNPGTAYAYMTGQTLNYSFGTGTAGTFASAVAIGSTALVVGRIDLNSGVGGEDAVSLWLNPNLVANSNIAAYTPVYSSSSVDWLTGITHIGAIAARADGGATGGGNVDNIRISDGGGNAAQAYLDVTGIPEPGSAALLGLGALGCLARRRPRAK